MSSAPPAENVMAGGDRKLLTRSLSICLDLVRVLAAFGVLVGHAVQAGLYSGPFPFSVLLQHNAVVVFFVLSGIVIASAVGKAGVDLRHYVIARLARIYPAAVVSVLFATIVYFHARDMVPADLNPYGYNVFVTRSWLAPVLFLSESYPFFRIGPVWNSPFWSLCYEFWYYILFGAAFFLKAREQIVALLIGALIAGPCILMLFPIWLLGAWLVRSRWPLRLPSVAAWPLLAAVPFAFWFTSFFAISLAGDMARAAPFDLGFSRFFLTDYLLGIAVTGGFLGLRLLLPDRVGLLERAAPAIRYFAGFSFTLYLFHWPILCLMLAYGYAAGDDVLLFAILLAAVMLICALAAYPLERQNAAVRRALSWFVLLTGRRN